MTEQDKAALAPCPSCGRTTILLRAWLGQRGIDRDTVKRVTVTAYDFRGGCYPYLASVRVDDAEVYRIECRIDEALAPDVLADITSALRRH